jgi:ubiquinone/menaquinone biosynthesis C-methylase UbiE
MLMEQCAPAQLNGIDPSAGQLDFARARPVGHVAEFGQGDATAIPFTDNAFDVALMALVLYFVPEPA